MTASNVTINGFTINDPNGATGAPGNGFGVNVASSVSGTNVSDNIITENVARLYLNSNGTNPSVVHDNLFANNNKPGSSSGDGIYSDAGLLNASITSNRFTGIGVNSAGIVLAGSAPQTGVAIDE